MSLILPDKWTWDFWLVYDQPHWHVFFLQADRSLGNPDLRHWNSSVGHAVSTDLRDWEYKGTTLAPSQEPGFDDATTWTGCILRYDDEWLLFYTGNSKADDKKVQRIGLARSKNLHDWQRDTHNPLVDQLPAPYENVHYPERWHDRSLRDPDVVADPVRGGWRMHFSARVVDQEADAAGCIGAAWSRNLVDWEVLPPVIAPGIAGELEVPQMMQIGKRWYMVFCTGKTRFSSVFRKDNPQATRQTGTHYFIADNPDGPWRLGKNMFFAGDEQESLYAGKLVQAADGLYFMGFMNCDNEGNFIGGLSDPIPVAVADDGELSLVGKEAALAAMSLV